MLLAIAGFELRKRFRMLSTLVYVLVFFAMGFLAMISAGGAFSGVSVGFGADKVHANAPAALNGLVTIFCHLGTLVTASVFGQALHQDREARIAPLFFSAPIRKLDYLGGRYLGAVVFSLVIFLAIAAGLAFGTIMPFVEKVSFGPNHLAAYLWPYLTTVWPNVVFTGAVFFALAGLGRQMMPVYVGAVLLVIGYLMAGSLFGRLEHRTLAALLDPFGMTASRLITEYWTVSEQNTRLVPLTGILLLNRALWLAIGVAVFAFTVVRFRLAHDGTAERKASAKDAEGVLPPTHAPEVAIDRGGRLGLLVRMTRLSFRSTVRDVYFGVIVFAGILFMVIASLQSSAIYGTPTYPVTRAIVEVTGGSFSIFALILITFYSGELVWRERDAKMDLIVDALPVPTWLPFLSKLLTLFLMLAVLMLVVMIGGIAIQTARGYFHYELGLYVKLLFGLRLVDFALLAVLALTVQVVVNHKYIGHFVMVLYYVWTLFMPKLGLEHNLVKFGGAPDLEYSDMNRFGHFLKPVLWFDLYWALFCVLLAIASLLLFPRGVESGARFRLREARRRLGPALAAGSGLAALAFVATGGFIYWNTNVRNHYRPSNANEAHQADYEKTFKATEKDPQPSITGVDVAIDIFPGEPSLHARGTYALRNVGNEPVRTVHVQLADDLPFEKLALGGVERPTRSDTGFGWYDFDLAEPLAPGATSKLEFDIWFRQRGFRNDIGDTEVVGNGTFFHSTQLPSIGYAEGGELAADGSRRKFALPPKSRMHDLDDRAAHHHNYVARDSDWIDFKATVSTAEGQTAIAPGYLARSWTENGRAYSVFEMDRKILGFWSVLSAEYSVKKDTWNGIPLEVYYHHEHTYDLQRMFDGMKDALAYCSDAFGPYQHRQARILEFPRYQTYAQSFPNTIPYSEAIGFIAKVDDSDPKDVDFPYYVTAHEIAHQWWAHQVIGADVQGATMLSETLAQYSALMVMKKKLGVERMRRFLAYELDTYLRQRAFERKRELPLLRCENQQYIHYNKGSLVMYALQDYAGEATVNRALHAFVDTWKEKGPPYPTTRDLVSALRKELLPEHQYLVDDMIENITLYDNRTTSATYHALPDGTFEVRVKVVARKMRADDLGVEKDVPVNESIDIGALDEAGLVLFREKRLVTSSESEHVFVLPKPPAKAGIDPMNILVDRKPDDNVMRAVEAR